LKIKKGRKVFKIPKVIGYQNLSDAKARIAHRYIRRTAAQVSAELPDVSSVVYRVEICKESRTLYDRIAEQARAKDKVIGSIVPLRRCCAAPVLVGGKGEDSGKLDELVRILDGELSGERCIIVTQWRETYIDIIKKRLKKLKPFFIHGEIEQQEREVTRRRFMEKERPILVMTEVGTRGLNLQVASVLINLDIHFNPAKMWQRIGRIYRIGSQHQHVRVISFLAADTIEERVYDKMSEKQDLFKTMFETDGVERLGDVVNKWTDRDYRKLI
jgi:SNF2 family DNA or RNA helicase